MLNTIQRKCQSFRKYLNFKTIRNVSDTNKVSKAVSAFLELSQQDNVNHESLLDIMIIQMALLSTYNPDGTWRLFESVTGRFKSKNALKTVWQQCRLIAVIIQYCEDKPHLYFRLISTHPQYKTNNCLHRDSLILGVMAKLASSVYLDDVSTRFLAKQRQMVLDGIGDMDSSDFNTFLVYYGDSLAAIRCKRLKDTKLSQWYDAFLLPYVEYLDTPSMTSNWPIHLTMSINQLDKRIDVTDLTGNGNNLNQHESLHRKGLGSLLFNVGLGDCLEQAIKSDYNLKGKFWIDSNISDDEQRDQDSMHRKIFWEKQGFDVDINVERISMITNLERHQQKEIVGKKVFGYPITKIEKV